jgi:hypothetical protein
MSDELVKRLREDQPVTQDMSSTMQCALQDAAADRIEELEAKLANAVEGLVWTPENNTTQWGLLTDAQKAALNPSKHGWELYLTPNSWIKCFPNKFDDHCVYRATIAELKG